MKRLAIVIQRFGNEINGGAEQYARILAQRLAKENDVTILTTCALDYYSWRNHYASGTSFDGKVKIIRFNVARQRKKFIFDFFHSIVSLVSLWENSLIDIRKLLKMSILKAYLWKQLIKRALLFVYNLILRIIIERAWVETQGPNSPDLSQHLEKNAKNYDAFIFFCYHYKTTFDNLSLARGKVILVPTAHDEPILFMRIWDGICSHISSLVFSTLEEQQFFIARFPNLAKTEQKIVGIGLEDLSNKKEVTFERLQKNKYVLYLGRIDSNKGCHLLFEYFLEYRKRSNEAVVLVLAGKEEMKVPSDPSIISLGFVTIEQKSWLLENCQLLILPSYFESLSLSVLEAWSKNKPVLVNGFCSVLAGQVERSKGGLSYFLKDSFIKGLATLLNDEKLNSICGKAGNKYYLDNYDWPIIDRLWKDIINLDSPEM